MSRADANGALSRFDADCAAGRIILMPLQREIVQEAVDLLRRLRLPHSPAGLRSLDAVHLATAISARATAVVTTDARLRKACQLAGLGVRP